MLNGENHKSDLIELLMRFDFVTTHHYKIELEYDEIMVDCRIKQIFKMLEEKAIQDHLKELEINSRRREPKLSSSIHKKEVTPVLFWQEILKILNPNSSQAYVHLAEFCLTLLSLPFANAEAERIFTSVNIIKSDLRNKIKTETVESLIQAKAGFKHSGINNIGM